MSGVGYWQIYKPKEKSWNENTIKIADISNLVFNLY